MAALNRLKNIASRTRKEFESGQVDESKLIPLYTKYNPLPDAKAFVEKSKRLFPELNCGLASVYLQDSLQKGEIIRGMYKGKRHTFLLIGEQTVVDITADQYGGPKIYVGPLKYPWKR